MIGSIREVEIPASVIDTNFFNDSFYVKATREGKHLEKGIDFGDKDNYPVSLPEPLNVRIIHADSHSKNNTHGKADDDFDGR